MRVRNHPFLGVTLIELLVVLAVMAALSGIALPALGSMVAGNDLNTAQENIINLLKKARGMAVSRSTISTVTITSANNTVQITAADGSYAETLQLQPSVKLAGNATLTFGAQGTMSVTAGSSQIVLSALNYPSLPTRTLNVSAMGVVSATR